MIGDIGFSVTHPQGHGHPKLRGHQQQSVSNGTSAARLAQIIYAILIAYADIGSYVIKPRRLYHCSLDYRHSHALYKTLPSAMLCLPTEQLTAIAATMPSAGKGTTELPAEYLRSHVMTCALFFPINVLNDAVGAVIVPTNASLIFSCSMYDWSIGAYGPWWPWAQHLGPWLGLCLLIIEIDESLRLDCLAHMCRSVCMLSRASRLLDPVISQTVLSILWDPHSVYDFLGSYHVVCFDDCAMTLVSLLSFPNAVTVTFFSSVSVLSMWFRGLRSTVCLLDDEYVCATLLFRDPCSVYGILLLCSLVCLHDCAYVLVSFSFRCPCSIHWTPLVFLASSSLQTFAPAEPTGLATCATFRVPMIWPLCAIMLMRLLLLGTGRSRTVLASTCQLTFASTEPTGPAACATFRVPMVWPHVPPWLRDFAPLELTGLAVLSHLSCPLDLAPMCHHDLDAPDLPCTGTDGQL